MEGCSIRLVQFTRMLDVPESWSGSEDLLLVAEYNNHPLGWLETRIQYSNVFCGRTEFQSSSHKEDLEDNPVLDWKLVQCLIIN